MFIAQVSNELKALRQRNGLTLESAAKAIDINKDTLSKYENDSSNIQLGMLDKILKTYKEDIYIFFTNVNEYIHKKNEK